ncbi:MAG: S8 family serine peptidase [Deltaproteobacteria bacterium]|nr:S8 family serine peptidase [Deltaproteobacteria bacterium]
MTKKLLAVLAAALSATVAQAAVAELQPLTAVPASAPGAMVDETPRLWFVELAGAPEAEGGSAAAVAAEQAGFRAEAARGGVSYAERHAFRTLFNGFSVRVKPSELGKLRRMTGVKSLTPVISIPAPQATAAPSPELFTALAMTGADVAHSQLGLTGRGVKVGVIDTGVDYDNADLGGSGVPAQNSTDFPNARVVTGWDFVGDDFNADDTSPTFNLTTTPDALPDDCAGHGTHVAGIIGANGLVTGVAPRVKIGAYRVFGCGGSTTADVMIAAMEKALEDGMDVVNMSIGSAFTWPQYPTAVAANRLVRKGVVVVASIGNSGASGLYSAGSPGLGKDVIGVASFDNTHDYLPYFTVSPDGLAVGYGAATGAPPAPTSGSAPLAAAGTACAALPAGSLSGQVALIVRGGCTFHVKAANAQAAGAAAVVLYNDRTGRVSPTVVGAVPITIPFVAITQADGRAIGARIAAGATEITWTASQGSFPSATGGLISSFSSYGLSPDLDLKPDLGAPGGSIYSTYPLEQGGHATLSGTSMASPHVAGAVALLLEARPHTPAREVRGILQNSADPKPWWGNPGAGHLDMVGRQGAGMVQIDQAVLSSVRITPAKLALGESQSGPVTRELEIENRSRKAVTYALSYENTVSAASTFTPTFYLSDATVTFPAPTVTVPARGEAEIEVTITPPTEPDKAIYGGYVVLTPDDGGAPLRVPYAGFVGDYQSIQVLAPTANGFPWLAGFDQGSLYKVTGPADWVYTMVGDDVPFFLVHLDHHSRLFEIDIYDEAGTKWLGHASTDEYLPRNSTAGGFFAWTWDGVVTKGRRTLTLANGNYVARISVLKALGHPFDPAHWETWTSPVIAVQR